MDPNIALAEIEWLGANHPYVLVDDLPAAYNDSAQLTGAVRLMVCSFEVDSGEVSGKIHDVDHQFDSDNRCSLRVIRVSLSSCYGFEAS